MGFPEAYDGRKLAAWLRGRGELVGEGKTVFGRTVARWAEGTNPMYWSVDKWLAPRGIHLDEIPDEIATEPRKTGGGRRCPQREARLRAEGVRLIREGWRDYRIAEEVGVHRRTVANWRKKMEVGK